MGTKLYVGNLPYETTEADLQTLFAAAGAVASVNLMRDRDTGRTRGFAFVEMANADDAQTAIRELDKQPYGGRNIVVNEARPMESRPRGAGGGGFGNRNNRRSEPRW